MLLVTNLTFFLDRRFAYTDMWVGVWWKKEIFGTFLNLHRRYEKRKTGMKKEADHKTLKRLNKTRK